MVDRGIDKLRDRDGDRGISLRLEPVFEAIYGLGDEDFLELVEQIGFVYAYQHSGTEDSEQRLGERLRRGVREARQTLERDVGD
jgi:hypothetical protein